MYIFYCAGGKFGEVLRETLSRRSTRRWAYASGVLSVPGPVRVRHWTLGTGRRLNPVAASSVVWLLQESLTESTGRSGCIWWCASGVRAFCSALWVRDRTLTSASGGVGLVTPRVCNLPAYKTGVHRTRPRLVLCKWPLEIDARKWKGQHLAASGAPDAGVERLVPPP